MEVPVPLPPKLIPVFSGDADVRAAHGGRGSGKTRTFAKLTAVRGMIFGSAGINGQILCGRQFQNSLADSSLEEIKRAIQDEPWLMDYYEIGETYVRSRDGRIEYTFAGLERNIDSIKSKGRILLCWVDEAEGVSDNAWSVLIPTLREEGDDWHAELWVTWNPKRKGSATDKRFRQTKDPRIKVAEINWRDNPKFPAVLERQRQRDLAERPDTYDWIWEGAYATVITGAYFAKNLTAAKASGRIGRLALDPLMRLRAFTDIGGTGKKADSFVWWVAQFIGREIRVLDHYETQGQPLEAHLVWARGKGYGPERMDIWLPHDGVTHDKVFDVSYESALNRAGYTVEVVPNQGPGAAIARIEAARRMFPSIWFNAETTEAGRDALGWYHEKRDEARDVGLGPEHDWASHSCFVGETLVLTRSGLRQIMKLPEQGEVLTLCGWKPYVSPRMTRRNARLVEVRFTDGLSVKCTPDHFFLTASGWRSAESLTPHTQIQSTWTRSHSISTVAFSNFGRTIGICRAAVSACIERLGALRSALFRMVATSTIETATPSTTTCPTLNACPPRLTCLTNGDGGMKDCLQARSSRTRQETRQRSGMDRRRVAYGTSATPSGLSHGQSGNEKIGLAHTAAAFFRHWFARAATQVSSALSPAKLRHTEQTEKPTSSLVAIESVRPLQTRADVWCITVPGERSFSLANGAVVHNCDAFGMMCIVAEDTLRGGSAQGALARRRRTGMAV